MAKGQKLFKNTSRISGSILIIFLTAERRNMCSFRKFSKMKKPGPVSNMPLTMDGAVVTKEGLVLVAKRSH